MICIVNDESWDYVPLPAGTSCRRGLGSATARGRASCRRCRCRSGRTLLGTIQADAGSFSTSISLGFCGAPESLSGRLDLGPDTLLECHGLRNVSATNGIFLQGLRTGINGDGNTSYWFTGQLPLSEADVAIQVSGGRLSPDSLHFTGTARLLVMPHLPVDDCIRHWPFETTKVEDREVPSVIDMREEEAFATLQAEGFTVHSSSAVDRRCNFIDRVMRPTPPAGTLALPGSLVRIVIGKRPRVCPRL